VTNLTDHQNATVESLLKGFCPNASRHDGIKREISKTLGDGTATDSELLSAVCTALVENSGVAIPAGPFPAAGAAHAAASHHTSPARHHGR